MDTWEGDPMSTAVQPAKLCVLFVDDERRLVEVYADIFGAEFDVQIATSGQEGLQKLRELKNVAVVMSDYHMPQMDGATFLREAMQLAPHAARVLLTGTAGLGAAKDAVNKGQIFRFLTKPCPLEQLRSAIEAGVDQYRLLNAERMVMQETLLECISSLMEVLAVTNPLAFGRAQRIKAIVQHLAKWLDCTGFWQLETAALLSQLGYFAVNTDLAEKMYYGRELSADEQARADAVPGNGRRLLEHIPRLEPVIQILAALEASDAELARAGDRLIGLGGRILGVALEYDRLANQSIPRGQILESLRARESRFGTNVVDALAGMLGATGDQEETLVMPLNQATPGMRLKQELRNSLGALLVPIGIEINVRLIDRISQIAPELLQQPVKLAPATRST
jgi:response regulator RpfG family c-di-GMP phosphodiesterase